MKTQGWLWAGTLLLLSGCSLIPEPSSSIAKVTLSPTRIENTQRVEQAIVLAPPEINKVLATRRVVFKPSDLTIDYIAHLEWVDHLEKLVQQTLRYSIEQSNLFASVHVLDYDLPVAYLWLKTSLEHFEFKANRRLEIVYHVEVQKMPERKSLGVHRFRVERSWLGNPLEELNAANHECVRKLLEMLRQTVRAKG